MILSEHAPLAPYTTLRVGGPARFLSTVEQDSDIEETIAFAKKRSLPLLVIGQGSNLLVPDEGVEAVVMRCAVSSTTIQEEGEGVVFTVGAGVLWEEVVDRATEYGVFGIENLAGIPGSLGGAAVQNIGAYGAEFSETFSTADVVSFRTGVRSTLTTSEARFGYRTSRFKQEPSLIILRVTLRLTPHGSPNLSYADLVRARDAGVPLTTPRDIARAVREIRSRKFPDPTKEGSAGSFFKNPILTKEAANALRVRYPELPQFEQSDGTVKISLAWMLDHVLGLKGYAQGPVRLYEKQPLVLVTSPGARARDVEELALFVADRVQDELGIQIDREVETLHVSL